MLKVLLMAGIEIQMVVTEVYRTQGEDAVHQARRDLRKAFHAKRGPGEVYLLKDSGVCEDLANAIGEMPTLHVNVG